MCLLKQAQAYAWIKKGEKIKITQKQKKSYIDKKRHLNNNQSVIFYEIIN